MNTISLYSALQTSKVDPNGWYIDSGATSHMSNNLKFFSQIEKFNDVVDTAGPESVQVKGIGVVNLSSKMINQEEIILEVKKALFVPNLSTNLLSVKQITAKGLNVNFCRNKCFISKNNLIVAEAILDKGGLYKLKTNPIANHVNVRNNHTTIDYKKPKLHKCFVCTPKNASQTLFKQKKLFRGETVHQEPGIELQNNSLSIQAIKNKRLDVVRFTKMKSIDKNQYSRHIWNTLA